MIEIPKPGKVNRESGARKKIWIFGDPFSGKTYFGTSFPKPLMLSTDGNYTFFDVPAIDIRPTVKMHVRSQIEMATGAEVFNDVLDQLSKNNMGYETVIIDLWEDVIAMYRQDVLDKMGLEHETDAGYGKGWDAVKTELAKMRLKVFSLPFNNIILISHTKKGNAPKDKAGEEIIIVPNVNDENASKTAGRCDFTGLITTNDNGDRVLRIKTDRRIFGGGRTEFMNREIVLSSNDGNEPSPIYRAVCGLYEGKVAELETSPEDIKRVPAKRGRPAKVLDNKSIASAEEFPKFTEPLPQVSISVEERDILGIESNVKLSEPVTFEKALEATVVKPPKDEGLGDVIKSYKMPKKVDPVPVPVAKPAEPAPKMTDAQKAAVEAVTAKRKPIRRPIQE